MNKSLSSQHSIAEHYLAMVTTHERHHHRTTRKAAIVANKYPDCDECAKDTTESLQQQKGGNIINFSNALKPKTHFIIT